MRVGLYFPGFFDIMSTKPSALGSPRSKVRPHSNAAGLVIANLEAILGVAAIVAKPSKAARIVLTHFRRARLVWKLVRFVSLLGQLEREEDSALHALVAF